ncbi:MAG: hypothetical protein HC861_07845 [Rhodospirillaceae bacterium]|nr:hypothetical protein [Rhodospirillaceae bacterium]
MRVLGLACFVTVLSACISNSAVADSYRYQDFSDRGAVKSSLYEQCIQDPMKLDGDPSYHQQDQFCHCLGDYLGDLLTDDEIAYVMQELAASESILEKEERANSTCNEMMLLQ